MRLNGFDWTMFVLLVIGGINWGLVGLFDFDLVAFLFGGMNDIVSRIIYTLVGFSAVYLLLSLVTKDSTYSTMDRGRTLKAER